MIKSSHFPHRARIFLPTSSASHPTVTPPHLLSLLVFGPREKLCKHRNILVLQIFFLLSHVHHGFIRKRWVKGMGVRRFVAVLIKLLVWNFSSKHVTNWDRILPCFGDAKKKKIFFKNPPEGSLPISTCACSSGGVSWYLVSLLSFLSVGIAVGAPRKWRGCELRGNEILPGVKSNFTERLKNLFPTWQMCYTA